MRVLFVIDSFGSGGSQRQMVNLAIGLADRGYKIDFFIYHSKFNFFEDLLKSKSICVYKFDKTRLGSFKILLYLIKLIKRKRYNHVISFLLVPSLLCEISKVLITNHRFKLIVSERSNYADEKSAILRIIYSLMHTFSDVVICNSQTQTNWLSKKYPWLRKKTFTIYNGYDTVNFTFKRERQFDKNIFKIVGVGRISPEKNIDGLLKGLLFFKKTYGSIPEVKWIGSLGQSANVSYMETLNKLINSDDELSKKWHWIGESKIVYEYISKASFLILPSFYEGLPNVLCESFFLGIPVLASNVCDNPVLIGNNDRGFLFDPSDPATIANALWMSINLNNSEYHSMSENCRSYAFSSLTMDHLVNSYLSHLEV